MDWRARAAVPRVGGKKAEGGGEDPDSVLLEILHRGVVNSTYPAHPFRFKDAGPGA